MGAVGSQPTSARGTSPASVAPRKLLAAKTSYVGFPPPARTRPPAATRVYPSCRRDEHPGRSSSGPMGAWAHGVATECLPPYVNFPRPWYPGFGLRTTWCHVTSL